MTRSCTGSALDRLVLPCSGGAESVFPIGRSTGRTSCIGGRVVSTTPIFGLAEVGGFWPDATTSTKAASRTNFHMSLK